MYMYVMYVYVCIKFVTTNYYYDCYCFMLIKYIAISGWWQSHRHPAKCVAKGEPSDWEDDVGGEFSINP